MRWQPGRPRARCRRRVAVESDGGSRRDAELDGGPAEGAIGRRRLLPSRRRTPSTRAALPEDACDCCMAQARDSSYEPPLSGSVTSCARRMQRRRLLPRTRAWFVEARRAHAACRQRAGRGCLCLVAWRRGGRLHGGRLSGCRRRGQAPVSLLAAPRAGRWRAHQLGREPLSMRRAAMEPSRPRARAPARPPQPGGGWHVSARKSFGPEDPAHVGEHRLPRTVPCSRCRWAAGGG